jgi:hypothetical protein
MAEKTLKAKIEKNAAFIVKDVSEEKLYLLREFLSQNEVRIICMRTAPCNVFLKVVETPIAGPNPVQLKLFQV